MQDRPVVQGDHPRGRVQRRGGHPAADVHPDADQFRFIGQREILRGAATDADIADLDALIRGEAFGAHHREPQPPGGDVAEELIDQPGGDRSEAEHHHMRGRFSIRG